MVSLQSLDAKDRELLNKLLSEHLRETGSAVAQSLLSDWTLGADRITKVMPREYHRVMELQSRAIEDGLDPDTELMKLFAVSGSNNG